MALAGALLLILGSLFAYSAEFPVDRIAILGKIAAAFPAVPIAFLFSPVVTVAVVTVPALLLCGRFLRQDRLAIAVALGALTLTPVIPGVTSWALYAACSMTGAVLLARSTGFEVRLPVIPWRTFLGIAVAIHLALTIAIAFGFFGGVPHVMDSVAQRFHAKIFAGGAAAAPAPPVPDAFAYDHLIIENGRWYSEYFPAHVFLESLFVRAGIAPLANPVIGVIGLFGVAALARRVAGEQIARVAVVLLLISPWWLLMHSEAMNHVTACAAITWALVLFIAGSPAAALGSGLLFGVAFLVRPFTAVLAGAAMAIYAIAQKDRRWWLCTAAAAVGALPCVLIMFAFNRLTTGAPLVTAVALKWGPGYGPGFHMTPSGVRHTPVLGLRNVLADLNAVNRWLLGIAVPPVVLLARSRRSWLWLVPAALLVGHFAFWYVDFCFGPRYVFEALPCLMILTALALREVWSPQVARLALLSLLAVPGIWFGIYQNYGHAFYGVDDRAARKAIESVTDDALVFVPPDQYGAYVWRNDPWLKHGPVYARDRGAANAEVIKAFPGRRVMVVKSPRASLLPQEGGPHEAAFGLVRFRFFLARVFGVRTG